MKQLAVWMYGREIGQLSEQRRSLGFAYTPEALTLGIELPLLSVSMPTRARRYTGAAPQAFFDGLLPEGEARAILAHDFKLGVGDTLGLLGALGKDCAGALVVLAVGEALEPIGKPQAITDEEVAERLRNLRFSPLGVEDRIRVSLAGVQEKLLLARAGDSWAVPLDGAPSTHILKPANPRWRDSVDNEALCMRMAKHLGVKTAEVEVCEFGERRVLAVERYDRAVADDGRVQRVHQEDGCQALAVTPRYGGLHKYEGHGGPSLAQYAQTLDRWSADQASLYELLDIVVINVLIGNADAHAKNLSLLHDEQGRVRMAPAYDLMATVHYEEVDRTPGMFVNGVRDVTAVRVADLVAEAAGWGLPAAGAKSRIDSLLEQAFPALEQAAAELDTPAALVEGVRQQVATVRG